MDAGLVAQADAAVTPDATAPDAGSTDAGAPRDAAPALDAAAWDVGFVDAGVGDSGVWGLCSVGGVSGVCIDVAECGGGRISTPRLCPGPAEIQCCTEPAQVFDCDPADHPQPNAGLWQAPGVGGCLAGMIAVADFCVDRFEAIVAEITATGTVAWSPYHRPDGVPVMALSVAGAVPQGYIDGRTAAAACAEAGKRLCTDDEWLRACQGASGLTFPYGDRRQDGVCNDARAVHPAIELFGGDPNPFARIQEPCINQLPDSVDRTGVNLGCVSAEGAFDMMGNLHEWTSAPSGTFRGGYYVDTYRNGPGCLYRTTAHSMGHWDYSTGFRCCADR